MIPGLERIGFGDGAAPLFPGQEPQHGFPAEPTGHRLRIAQQRNGCGRYRVKTLAQGCSTILHRLLESLRDIIGVDMMDGLPPDIRQRDFFSRRQPEVHVRVKIPLRIQGRPAGADDVAGVNDGSREAIQPRFPQEVLFNQRLAISVIAERSPRLRFGGGHDHAWPVNPDGPAMQKMLDSAA